MAISQHYKAIYQETSRGPNELQTMQSDGYPLELTISLLLEMKEIADSIGAKVLVVVIPDKGCLDAYKNNSIYFQLAPLITKGIYIINLFPILAESKQLLYYENEFHWTPEGHKLGAEAIFNYLMAHKELVSSPPF